jgi:predicted DNA-binding transcriptional regulator AlpA
MNYERALLTLRSIEKVLTVPELAVIFDVHPSTVERWLKCNDFPKAQSLNSKRYFRPDHVIDWIERQQAASKDMLAIDAVCERCGMCKETFHKRMKANDAPGPCMRELGTGRQLWDGAELDAWIRKKFGRYTLPPPRATQPPKRGTTKQTHKVHAATI